MHVCAESNHSDYWDSWKSSEYERSTWDNLGLSRQLDHDWKRNWDQVSVDWEPFVLSTQVNPSYPVFLESHNYLT